MIKHIFSLGPLAAANVVLATVSHCYIFLKIGPGIETDAFYAGIAVPQLVLSVLSSTMFYVMVPLLAGEEEKKLSQGVWWFFLTVGGAVGALGVVLFVSAPLWTALLLPGFAPECLSLSVELTRIQLIGMFFSAQSCVLRAACHARQKYFWAEFSQLVEALLGMSTLLWLVPIWGIYGAAWTYVLRAILLALLLLPGIGRRSGPDRGGVLIRTAWRRVKPLAIASLYYKSGPLVDRFLTSLAPPGGLSFFYFSQQFFEVANHLINRAAAAPALPLLTVQIKTGNPQLFKNTYRGQLLVVFVLAVLSMIVFVHLAEPLLRLARKIDEDGVRLFWWITVAFAGFFIGGAMGQVLSSAFYARGDVQTPTKVGVVGFSVGTGLKLLGFQLAGLPGIALATSFYYLGNAAALYLLLERKESVLSEYGGA